MGLRVKDFYQLDFENVYGEKWEYHAVNPFREGRPPEGDGQLSLEDLYNPSVLGEESREDYIRRKFSPLARSRICVRTILSGDMVEIDMYPAFLRKDMPRGEKSKASRQAQKNLNNKNRVKNLVRLINANFSKKDFIVTLTYEDGNLPTEERAKKDMVNFLARVRRRRKKQGLPPLKYIYVTEFVPEGERTRKVRIHHHLIMSGGLDRDEVEGLWGKGRCRVERCQPDDFELTGFADYIGKLEREKGRHSYCSSKNLDKPKVHKSVTKLSRRRFMEIIRAGDGRAELLESLYKDKFRYLDSTTYVSQEFGGFYLYSRLRRRVSVWEEKGGGMDRSGKGAPGRGGNAQGGDKSVPDAGNASFGGVLPSKAFLEYDWKGTFAAGEAIYSIVLEAVQRGVKKTAKYVGRVSEETRNRAELIMAEKAISLLTKPCCVELHTKSSYLHGGIMLDRFKLQQRAGYNDIKNADLIDRFLGASEKFRVSAVKEDGNEYSEDMGRKRKQEAERIERGR